MALKRHEKIFFDAAEDTATFYGFNSLGALHEELKKNRTKKVPKPNLRLPKGGKPEFYHTERFQLLREYLTDAAQGSTPHLIHYRPCTTAAAKQNLKRFGLEIVNSPKSIAEAIIIQTAMTILKDTGHKDVFVDINSVGDIDCKQKFARECGTFYRKHMSDLPTSYKDLMRRNIFDVLRGNHEKCKTLRDEAPKPMNFLSDPARIHFREVLEYLEHLGIPYRINNVLSGEQDCYSRTVFELHKGSPDSIDPDEPLTTDTLLARGGRYDELPRRVGYRKNIPAVGLSFYTENDHFKGMKPKKVAKRKPNPKVFLIHLGFDAKLLSLQVIEALRHARIPLYQMLSRDRIGTQLNRAEALEIPYILIIGQKEATENSVLIRDMKNLSQSTVPLDALIPHLKKIIR